MNAADMLGFPKYVQHGLLTGNISLQSRKTLFCSAAASVVTLRTDEDRRTPPAVCTTATRWRKMLWTFRVYTLMLLLQKGFFFNYYSVLF